MRIVPNMDESTDARAHDEMTPTEKRRDQLLAAPDAVESDADPRIAVTRREGVTRIDILPDADVRPGDPSGEPTGGQGS